MALLFDRYYKVNYRDDIGSPPYWNSRLKSLDARIGATEEVRADLEEVIDEGRTVFRDKVNETLQPLVEEVFEIANVGVMLRAHSATEHSVSIGGKTFTIDEGERLRFAAPAYVAVFRTDSPSAAMLGEVVSYDSGTGELVVDVGRVSGEGTHGGWTISPASPSDTAEAIDQVLAASLSIATSLQQAETTLSAAIEAKDLAGVKAGEADASSGSASDSADRADASIATLQAIYATQSQIELGAHASDPTVDLNGDPLVAGAEYYNTAAGQKKIYDGVGWTISYVPVGSEVTSIYGRTGNVVATVGDYSADKISLTAVTGMISTQLQAAIEELKTDTVGLQTNIDGKSALGHGHTIADVTGLQGALDGKSETGHTHAFADLTAKPTTVAGYGLTDAYTKSEADGLLAPKATTSYVDAQISLLIGGAPAAALDTIAELATALTDNDSDIASILSTLASKSNVGHGHAISDVTGLQSALDGKTSTGHGHAISDVTNLLSTLNTKLDATGYTAADVLTKIKTVDGSNSGLDADLLDGVQGSSYVQTSRSLTAGTGLSGGGTLVANRTFSLDFDELTEETSPAAGDMFAFRRASDGLYRKVQKSNIGGGAWELISTAVASDQASVEFTGLSADHIRYAVEISGARSASDNVTFILRLSSNNGVSWDTGGSDYRRALFGIKDAGTTAATGDPTSNYIRLASNMGNGSAEFADGVVNIYDPMANKRTHVGIELTAYHKDNELRVWTGGGMRVATSSINAIQFLMDSGNVAAGTFKLYGLRG